MFFPLSDENPRHSRVVTLILIILNVGIFLYSLQDFEYTIFIYGFIPAYASILTAFTSMFLHGGFDHLFGNMWYLWIFGDNVEGVFGKIHYLFFYLASGFAAVGAHYLTNPGSLIPTIGASGAISGVLGAYLVLFPQAKIKAYSRYTGVARIPAVTMLGLWFLIQLLFSATSLLGETGSGVAFAAHAGGFAFGYLYARVFKRLLPNRVPDGQQEFTRRIPIQQPPIRIS
jgi:membrane associated rhomboid family serine protease